MKDLITTIVLLFIYAVNGSPQGFTDSNLPIIIINTDGGVQIPDAPRVFGSMKIINRGNGQRNYVNDRDNSTFLNYNGRISIELRGSSSQVMPKKQYAFSTLVPADTAEANVSILGLPEDNDWVLNGMVWDPVVIRDYICYTLYRKMGEYASRTVYCEVILNNDYIGLYLLQEKVKHGKERVNVLDIKKSDYFLPNLTGGYIIKSDRGTPIWTMPSYIAGQDVPFVNVLPKAENAIPAQNDYIKKQFFSLQGATHIDNTNYETGYPSIIDIPSFIDYMLLTEYSSNCDNYQYSTFYHKDRNGKLRAGPIWDSDLTFGNDLFIWGYDRSHYDVWQFSNGDNQGPMYWKDLFTSHRYACVLFKRWRELTGEGGPMNTDSMDAFINRTRDYISEAVVRNNARWNVAANFAAGLENIKVWIRARIGWINTWAESTTDCPDPVIPPLVITKIMYHPDSTVAFPKPKDYEFIEIKNISNRIVSLSGDYFLGTGFVYQFPPFSQLNPGGAKILASNETAFRQRYGFAPSGQFTRNLSNMGEKLMLGDAFGNIIDYVNYSDSAPWPDADGNGAYLELIDSSLDNNNPANWIANHNSIVSDEVMPEKDRIRLFPVPARDFVSLQSDIEIEKIELFSLQGVLLKREFPNSSEYVVDLGRCPAGIYYAKITAGGYSVVKKIVKE